MKSCLVAVSLLVSSSIANAAPNALVHQGRLLASDGNPINGEIDIRISLYGASADTTPFWTHEFSNEPVEDGYYAVRLVTSDSGQALDSDDFADGDVWIDVSAGGVTLEERHPLSSVPFALTAGGVQVPVRAEGPCTAAGSLGYDDSSGVLLLCHDGTYVPVGDPPPPPLGDFVAARRPGFPGEWALVQAPTGATFNTVTDWSAFCSAANLAMPSVTENNANCQENIPQPRHDVGSSCNSYSEWQNTTQIWQQDFPGGQVYVLYAVFGPSSSQLHSRLISCTNAASGTSANSTCGSSQSITGVHNVPSGAWVTCARLID